MNPDTEKPAAPDRFCHKCGKPLTSGFNFCPFCGAHTTSGDAATAPKPAEKPVSPEAKKALDNFDAQFAMLQAQRGKKPKLPGLLSFKPDPKIFVAVGVVITIILIVLFVFLGKYLTYLAQTTKI